MVQVRERSWQWKLSRGERGGGCISDSGIGCNGGAGWQWGRVMAMEDAEGEGLRFNSGLATTRPVAGGAKVLGRGRAAAVDDKGGGE